VYSLTHIITMILEDFFTIIYYLLMIHSKNMISLSLSLSLFEEVIEEEGEVVDSN
jgi:hypothetical protein